MLFPHPTSSRLEMSARRRRHQFVLTPREIHAQHYEAIHPGRLVLKHGVYLSESTLVRLEPLRDRPLRRIEGRNTIARNYPSCPPNTR